MNSVNEAKRRARKAFNEGCTEMQCLYDSGYRYKGYLWTKFVEEFERLQKAYLDEPYEYKFNYKAVG
jgi:hypothetical protein